MSKSFAALAATTLACGGTPHEPPVVPATPVATVDARPPDAAPDAFVDRALAAAPAAVFRFHQASTPDQPGRLETWTLRLVDDRAAIHVERATADGRGGWIPGAITDYAGAATVTPDRATLALAAPATTLALTCTHDKLAIAPATATRAPSTPTHKPGKRDGAACAHDPGKWIPTTTTTVAVWSCTAPGFAAPMMFAPAPGVEYVAVDDGCALRGGGYRAIADDAAIAPTHAGDAQRP